MANGFAFRRLRQTAVAAYFGWFLLHSGSLNFSSPGVQRRHLGLLPVFLTTLVTEESLAEEPFNPLKLKGYFWETGKFYEGETSESVRIPEILAQLNETQALLQLGDL